MVLEFKLFDEKVERNLKVEKFQELELERL
jgi:hypothetical protein